MKIKKTWKASYDRLNSSGLAEADIFSLQRRYLEFLTEEFRVNNFLPKFAEYPGLFNTWKKADELNFGESDMVELFSDLITLADDDVLLKAFVKEPDLVRAWEGMFRSSDNGIKALRIDYSSLNKFNAISKNNNLGIDADGLAEILDAAGKKGQEWDEPNNILDAVIRASDANIQGLLINHRKFPQSSSGSSFVLDNAKQFQKEASGDANLNFELNGISFDNIHTNGKLIDRKFGHSSSIFDKVETSLDEVYNVTNQNRAQSLMDQAFRQINAVGGNGSNIRWEVSTPDGAGGISQLFNDPANIANFPGIQNIEIVYVSQQTIIN